MAAVMCGTTISMRRFIECHSARLDCIVPLQLSVFV